MAFRKDDTMRLTITIECDNAAFDNGVCHEVARILKNYTDVIVQDYQPMTTSLQDINGNTVGQAKITKGRR